MTEQDHIFGPLSTNEHRVDFVRENKQGVKHENMVQPLAPSAGVSPTVTVHVGVDTTINRLNCQVLEPEPLNVDLHRVDIKWDAINWRYYEIWQGQIPAQPSGTIVRYNVLAWPSNGAEPFPADDGETYSYFVGDPKPPSWSKSAVIYQIFPDRFHPGNQKNWNNPKSLEGFFGGTLRGIIDKLDYVADLGFNCIWLNPFFPDHTYHGYHATDYFKVNPRLGSKEDIQELVAKAHELDIRLLMDFVANHWGSQHPTFQAAQANREDQHYDWYRWHEWPDDYATFFNVGDLPQINLDHQPARRHLLEAAQFWLQEFNFDGMRLDYALGPSLDFWTDFRATVQRVKSDAWIFGEVVEMPSTQLRYWGRLHGCLDFLLQESLRKTFALGTMTLTEFESFLTKHEAFFPKEYSRPSFLDNHDVNRFSWLAKGDNRKLKLAALCQFTLAGPPIVYYGTEAGLSQERDMRAPDGSHHMAEARLPMIWGDEQDEDLRSYYRQLIALRRQHPVFWCGTRRVVHLDEEDKTYAYQREDEHKKAVVVFNMSEEERQVKVADSLFRLLPWSGDVKIY